MSTIVKAEHSGEAFGVPGRFHNVIAWPDSSVPERCRGRIANQKFTATRKASDGGRLTVTVRFDDECKNGHEDLSITGYWKHPGGGESGGCIHEEIAETFPEFAPLIPYHLCGVNGPMHYLGNVLYFAGNRDCHGLQSGQIQYQNELTAKDDDHREMLNRKTLHGKGIPSHCDWQEKHRRCGPGEEGDPCAERLWLPLVDIDPECQLESFETALLHPIHRIGEGKERELDAARRSAIWPEATDDDLCSDRIVLERMLKARLPELLKEFRSLIEGFGFLYEAAAVNA